MSDIKKRLYFTPRRDIKLLKLALAHKPWSSNNGWSALTCNMRKIDGFSEVEAKSLRDRISLLIVRFQKKDMESLKKSGTEEEYSERERLLQDLSELKWNHDRHSMKLAPTVFRGKAAKSLRMASKATVSNVWKFFKKSPFDSASASCNICKQKFKYAHSSTANLKKHLTRKHSYEYLGIEKPVDALLPSSNSSFSQPDGATVVKLLQPTITTNVERTRVYPRTSERKKELDQLLMKMIVEDTQPLSIVEDRGFMSFVRALDQRYELPSRRQVAHDLLPSLYEEQKQKVMEQLLSASDISVTTDIWSAGTTEGYLTMTAHFVTSDFKMMSFVLSTSHMTKDNTAHNIASEMESIFETWGIQGKVQAVVSDNAENMLAAIKQELKLRSLPCFAHSLNLVIQDSIRRIEQIDDLKQRVKAIVRYFHHNIKASDKLKDMQKLYGRPKKLIQDVETRWNATSAMFKRYAEQHQAVTSTLCQMSKTNLCISDAEVEEIKAAVEALEPFHLVTEEMSSESKVSLSKMIPFIKLLHRSLSQGPHSSSPLVMELQRRLRMRFSMLEDNFVANAATLLDPRFKLIHFSSKDATIRTQQKLKEILSQEYRKEQASQQNKNQETTDDSLEEPSAKRRSIWDAHDEEVKEIIKKSPMHLANPETEMTRYLESPLLLRSEDPLEWWRENKKMLPHLSKLAQKFLGIPATSIPAERLFSKAGEQISAKRNSLKDSHVNQMLFLNKNMR